MAAPKFEIVEKPNDFVKVGNNSIEKGELNKSQSERLTFWTQFNEVVENAGKPFKVRKANTNHWYDVAVGTQEAHIEITLLNQKNKSGIAFYIKDNKNLFDSLFKQKDKIEANLDFKVSWQRLDDKKYSPIITYIPNLDFDNHSNYIELMQKIIDRVVKIKDAFHSYY